MTKRWMKTLTLGVSIAVLLPLYASGAGAQTGEQSIGSTLASGARLNSGQMMVSTDDTYGLVMQPDGNLVLYYQSSAEPLWATNTDGNPGARLTLQADDGNLVLESEDGSEALWSTGTTSFPGDTLTLQTDGNLVLYNGTSPVWASDTLTPAGSILEPGQSLGPNEYLESPNGAFRLLNAGAVGTLFEYSTETKCPYWVAPELAESRANDQITYTSASQPGSTLYMQTDGNLVLAAPDSTPLWDTSTMTSGNYVTLQDDGNFVMYNPSTSAPWSANTAYLRGYELCPGTNLTANQFIQTTGEYNDQVEGLLTFNSNCTLELESGKDWSTPTATNEAGKKGNSLNPSIVASGGYDGCYAVMQTDGNLVIYAPNYPGGGIALWASNTAGNPGAMLLLQQDGCQGCDANASIYSSNGALLAGYPDDKTGTSVGFQGGNTAGSVGKFFTKLLLS